MKGHGRFSVFSIAFGLVYVLAFYFSVAVFKYYPLVGQFHVVDQGKAAGPPISWYGWLVTALLVSLPVAFKPVGGKSYSMTVYVADNHGNVTKTIYVLLPSHASTRHRASYRRP